MIVHECDQMSDLWWAARRGIPTASEFSSIICPKEVFEVQLAGKRVSGHRERHCADEAAEKLNKKTPGYEVVGLYPQSEGALGYVCQLIADRVNPEYGLSEGYVSAAMRNGIMLEPTACEWYSLHRGVEVQKVGFCTTDDGRFGWSPDRQVGLRRDGERWKAKGAVEVKCPEHATLVRWLLDGGLPDDHKCQCHGGLVVGGLEWIDFFAYADGLPPLLIRVEPDAFTEKLRGALDQFHDLYMTTLARLNLT